MRTFTTFLTEQKNLHLEHLEDELFNRGEAGVNEAIAFLKSLSEMLKGNAKTLRSSGTAHLPSSPEPILKMESFSWQQNLCLTKHQRLITQTQTLIATTVVVWQKN